MTRLPTVVWILLACVGSAHAGPIGEMEYGTVPVMEPRLTEGQCRLSYYNFCSGWLFHWGGYCYGDFDQVPEPPQYGTCFDLADCSADCRHLEDVWWACKRFIHWGSVDVEVYCANEEGCPIGSPLGGAYHVWLSLNPWQHFTFGGIPLCACEETGSGKFIVMITQYALHPEWGRAFVPQSDINSYNIDAGCETDWRCEGHSFVYRNSVSYCDVYGYPGAMWVSGEGYGCTNPPQLPPGCHDYYWSTGFYTEWLIHCYLSCQGPTQTERKTWSAVKSLYR